MPASPGLRNPRDIYASLRPLLFVGFVCGIMPFKAVGSSGDRHLVVSVLGLAITFFHLVWFCAYYGSSINNKDNLVYMFNSKFSRLGEDIQIITSIVIVATILSLCFLKRNKLQKLLELFIQIDEKFIDSGVKVDFRNVSKTVWIVLFIQWSIQLSFITAISMLLRFFEDIRFCDWINSFMILAIVLTYESKYVCIMRLILSRFHCINVTLNNLRMNADGYKLCRESNDTVVDRFGQTLRNVEKLSANVQRKKTDIIAELCRIHTELCDACDLAEAYFNHQMLAVVTIGFVMSVFNLYFIIDVAFVKTPIKNIDSNEFLVYHTLDTTIGTGALFCLLHSAGSVTSESENCAINVHKLLNVLKSDESELKALLTQFSMQLSHQKIKFTACGLFPLDHTLIFTMVAAVTTYLVILFQVGDSMQ